MKKNSDLIQTMTLRQICDWTTMRDLCAGETLVEHINQNGLRLDIKFSDAANPEEFELTLLCPSEPHAIQWCQKLEAFQLQ